MLKKIFNALGLKGICQGRIIHHEYTRIGIEIEGK